MQHAPPSSPLRVKFSMNALRTGSKPLLTEPSMRSGLGAFIWQWLLPHASGSAGEPGQQATLDDSRPLVPAGGVHARATQLALAPGAAVYALEQRNELT